MIRFLLLAGLFFLGCAGKKQQDQKAAVLSLKEMSELATVEYTVTKIIKANDNKTWFKLGDRKILMSCEANIKAGIDLAKLTQDDFSINDKTIIIRLPYPKIISLNIPPEKLKVEYQEVSAFRDPFKSGERDALAAQAETQIKNSVDQLGILEQAKANTSLFVSNFLKQIGYENISISFANSSPQNTLQ